MTQNILHAHVRVAWPSRKWYQWHSESMSKKMREKQAEGSTEKVEILIIVGLGRTDWP